MALEDDDEFELTSNVTVGKDFDLPAITNSVSAILKAVGEDPTREGLVRTPDRVARAYQEILGGYQIDPVQLINGALFSVDYDEMVIVKDIEYYSLCEHHMLPFFGKAHVAYVPRGKVLGLSKIPRIVDMFAHRLQVQERMTQQIAQFVQEVINPWGVGVVIEGQHLCMMMRGIKKEQAKMTTSAMLGGFRKRLETRMEFLNRISN